MKTITIRRLALAALLAIPAGAPPAHAARSALASHHDGLSGMTTAAKYLPCGTRLQVWNTGDRRARRWTVTVRDYGPFVGARLFDLSPFAFRRVFGSTRKGVCRLSYRVIRRGKCRLHKHDGSL